MLHFYNTRINDSLHVVFLLHVCLYVYVVIQPLAAKPNKSINRFICQFYGPKINKIQRRYFMKF